MMLRRICTVLLISFLTASAAWSQNWQQTQDFAQAALDRGDFKTALLTFQRLAFFNQGGNKALINFQIARCYHLGGKLDLAARYYDNCFYIADDSLAQQAVIGKIGLLLSGRRFNEALAELYSLEFSTAPRDTQRLAFFEGLAHFGNMDFNEAHLAFSKALPKEDTLARNELNYFFLEDKRLHSPNPKLAHTLSFIVPGMGQFYAGDVKNGLNSLALSAGLVAIAVNIAATYSLFDAGLAVVPWLQRYYLGGTEKAKIIAERKRLENRAALYNDVLELFSTPRPSSSGS